MNKQTISNDFYNMTKEEKLKYRTQCAKNALKEYRYRQTLKQEPAYCDRNICLRNEYNGIGCDECEVTKSQEPCGDAISRQAVMDALCDGCELYKNGEQTCFTKCEEYHFLATLPPVTPQPKDGKWIDYSDEGFVECPFCGHATNCEDNIDELHYCFYCGARMVDSQESENKK